MKRGISSEKRIRLLHRVIAVAVSIFMVVSILPSFNSEAAKYIEFYSGYDGVWNYDGGGNVNDMIASPPYAKTTDPTKITYMFYRIFAKNKHDFGIAKSQSELRDVRITAARHMKASGANGGTSNNYTFIYGLCPINIILYDQNDNEIYRENNYKPILSQNALYVSSSGTGSLSADIIYPTSAFFIEGKRIVGDRINLKSAVCGLTGKSTCTTPGGVNAYSLGFINVESEETTFGVKFDINGNVTHSFGNSKGENCIGHYVRAESPHTMNLGLQLEYETAPDTYLTYVPNGGNGTPYKKGPYQGDGLHNASVLDNDVCQFEREHYAFNGWNSSADGKGKDYVAGTEKTVNMMYDKTLYAQWRQTEFQVTYDPNGADTGYENVPETKGWYGLNASFTVEQGNTEDLPLKKSGHVFTGWNTAADGSGTDYAPGETFTIGSDITKDITLYAQWDEAPKHYLNYHNGGESGTMSQETYYEDGIPANGVVTVKDNAFTSSRYTFLEWEKDDDDHTKYQPGDTFDFNMSKSEETLKARWGAVLTYNANASDNEGEVPKDTTVYDFQNGGQAEAKGNTGNLLKPKHVFGGWDDKPNAASEAPGTYQEHDKISFTENKTVYAHWNPAKEYQISYELNAPEGLTDADMQGSLPKDMNTYYNDGLNEKITVKSASMQLPGYRFDGWKDDAGRRYRPGETYRIDKNSPQTIQMSACWVPAKPYKVTYDPNLDQGEELTAGTVPVDIKSPYYNDLINDEIEVLDKGNMERDGYVFKEWNTETDGSGEAYSKGDVFHVSRYGTDVTLFAQWQKKLTITGVQPTDKIYDGSASFDGTVAFSGKKAGDDVRIDYTTGTYHKEGVPSAAAENKKELFLEGLELKGKDAGKYILTDCTEGSFSETAQTYETTGTIMKRPVTVAAAADRMSITTGDIVPAFYSQVTKGSLASGDRLNSDFGTAVYECVWQKDPSDRNQDVKLKSGDEAKEASADYELRVSGLSNDNYDITFESVKFAVNPPGSTPVHITYKAGNNGFGTAPADGNTYYIYSDPAQNSEAAVLSQGALYSPGCVFAGWNTDPAGTDEMIKADGTKTKLLQAGDKITVKGNVTLYAVWKGNTVLTLTGLSDKTKIYDGTTSWSGTVLARKADPGDDVKVSYNSAAYDTKDAGTGKTITLRGITLTGADAYKYKLSDGGMYSLKSDEITISSGEITKRPLKLSVTPDPLSVSQGDPMPVLNIRHLTLADGTTLGTGDSLSTDFGTPVFTFTDRAGNSITDTNSSGIYYIRPSGLKNDNYSITCQASLLTITGAAGQQPVNVSYNLNGGIGVLPVDNGSYFVYQDDPSKNSQAAVLGMPGALPEKDGCLFAGWNTSPDGTDIITKQDGTTTTELQAGDVFTLYGDTTLYAVWKPNRALKITGITNTDKVYDNSDMWTGKALTEGIQAGDDVKVIFDNGKYDSSQTGAGKLITAENVRLTGTDAYKYYIDAGSDSCYNPADRTLIYTGGEIKKRPITIGALVTSNNPVECGTDEPVYSWDHTGGTFAPGEDKNDLDASGVSYILKKKDGSPVLWQDVKEAELLYASVSGIINDNYDITFEDAILRVKDADGNMPALVIYHADDADSGTVPSDPNVYMVYADSNIEKPQAEILSAGDLKRDGYRFAGWKNRADGRILQPGRKLAVADMVHLDAVWAGDTHIKITGLTNQVKVYDGTEEWTGNVVAEGIIPGDDIKITCTHGSYSDKNAGDKTLKAQGIQISGSDIDKYVLDISDIYDPDENAVIINGKIKPRDLTVLPVVRGFDANQAVLKQGDVIPPYELYLPSTSHIITPDELKDFGEPLYDCRNYLGESLSSQARPGYYRLKADGIEHQNYAVNTEITQVQVWAPGMKKVSVSYRPGGGYGAGPVDNNDYAVFSDKTQNSIVTVMGNTYMRQGYRFTGWNTRADGRGKMMQAGETFRIMGDTILYAQWEKIASSDKNPDQPDGGKDAGKDSGRDPGGPEKPEQNQKPGSEEGAAGTEKGIIASDMKETKETGTGTKAAGNSAKNEKEKDSFTMSETFPANSIKSFGSEPVPKSGSPYKNSVGHDKDNGTFGIFGGRYGEAADCIIHWLILLLMAFTILYDVFRARKIRGAMERAAENGDSCPEKAKLFRDQIIPLLPIPMGLLFFLLRRCPLDIWFIIVCIGVAEVLVYRIGKAYQGQEDM